MHHVVPIFLLSLPRAGSTLVQRVLATNPEIATGSEPWLLLPQFYALRARGVYAEYGHALAARGIEDFCGLVPGGMDTYRAAIARFATDLYSQASQPGARYFLDKTPRYHLIANELLGAFPQSRVIFLWRNPLAVAASMISTWGGGRWTIHRHRIDLYDGLSSLIRAYDTHQGRAIAVNYESLVCGSQDGWKAIFRHLGLPYQPESLQRFAEIHLPGRLGDPTGVRRYTEVSPEPLTKWRKVMASPVRKRWCQSYLDWLGTTRLAAMGYDKRKLEDDLEHGPSDRAKTVRDLAWVVYGKLATTSKPWIVQERYLRVRRRLQRRSS